MSKELPFIVLCVEEYKNRKGMSASEVMDLFNRYSVCEYLRTYYDALHTMEMNDMIDDIDSYISSRKPA